MRRFYRRYKSSNGLSPETNRLVGSVLRIIFIFLILFISYSIWGIKIFSEIWFYIAEIVAFFSVKFFLIAIGFWDH